LYLQTSLKISLLHGTHLYQRTASFVAIMTFRADKTNYCMKKAIYGFVFLICNYMNAFFFDVKFEQQLKNFTNFSQIHKTF